MALEHTRFLWNNLADDGTYTASSAATNYPVANIQNHWPTFAWRSTGDTSEWVAIDLGSEKAISALVIKGHNFTSGATVRIQADAHAGYGSLSVNETLAITSGTMTFFWATPQSYQYWRITIADDSNPDTYVKIGRVFLGSYFAPAYDVSSYSMQIEDPSEVGLSVGRQSTSAIRSHYKTWAYTFAYVKESDKETFEDIFTECGFAKPYFIVENIYDSASTRYVRNGSAFSFNFLFYDTDGIGFAYDMDFSLIEEL